MANGLQFLGNVATGVASGIQTAQSIQANQQKLKASEMEISRMQEEKEARTALPGAMRDYNEAFTNIGSTSDEKQIKRFVETEEGSAFKDNIMSRDESLLPTSGWSPEINARFVDFQMTELNSKRDAMMLQAAKLSPENTFGIFEKMQEQLNSTNTKRKLGLYANIAGLSSTIAENLIAEGDNSEQVNNAGNAIAQVINSNREILGFGGSELSFDFSNNVPNFIMTGSDGTETSFGYDQLRTNLLKRNYEELKEVVAGSTTQETRELELKAKQYKFAELKKTEGFRKLERDLKLSKDSLGVIEQGYRNTILQLDLSYYEQDKQREIAESVAKVAAQQESTRASKLTNTQSDAEKQAQKVRAKTPTAGEIKTGYGFAIGDGTNVNMELYPEIERKRNAYIPIFNILKNSTSDHEVAKIASNIDFLEQSKRLGEVLFVNKDGKDISQEGGISNFETFVNDEMGGENKKTFESAASRWFANKGFKNAFVQNIGVGGGGNQQYKLHYMVGERIFSADLNDLFEPARNK
mgnify:FL=1